MFHWQTTAIIINYYTILLCAFHIVIVLYILPVTSYYYSKVSLATQGWVKEGTGGHLRVHAQFHNMTHNHPYVSS